MDPITTTPNVPATTETPSVATTTPSVSAEKPAATWDEAYARVDAAAAAAPATPETPESPALEPAPATTEPPPAEDVPVPGEPPKERWPSILENARKKGHEAAIQEFQQQYGGGLEVVQALRSDLPGTLGQLLDEAITSPEHGASVRAMLGQKLSSLRRQTTPPPVEDAEPQIYVQGENGETFVDPAALPKRDAWLERRLERKFEEKFKPIADLQQQVEHAQAIARFQAQSQQTVTQRLEFWKTQPGFTTHAKAIAAKQKELFEANHANGMDEWTALGMAYAQIVPPLLQQQQQTDLTATAVAKAAGRSDNPAASAPAPPRRPKTWDEAYAQVGLV